MIRMVPVCLWVVALCVVSVQSCTPTEQPPLVQKVHMADVVIHGIVENTYEDGRFDYGTGTTVYTAKMLVYCMYKGPRGAVPMYINVTEAGYIPGHCVRTDLVKGSSYIVLLHRSNGDTLKPLDVEIEPTQENKNEIMKACNVNVQYPSDANVNNYKDEEKCPTPAEQCVPDERGDDDFESESEPDHEHVDDSHLGPNHDHEDHHFMGGDGHQHDHNNDGKHDHEDHHLDHSHDSHEAHDHVHDDHSDEHHEHAHEHHHEQGSEEDDNHHDHDHDGDHDDDDHHLDHDHDGHDSKDDHHGNEGDTGKKETQGKDAKTEAVVGGGKNSSNSLHSFILLSVLLSITTVMAFQLV